MQWSLVERGTATGSGKCARRRGVIGFLAASSSGEVIYESNDELVYRFVPVIGFAGGRSADSTAASIS
jgi:hypothetical protein